MDLLGDEDRAEQERLTFEVFDQWVELTKERLLDRAEATRFVFMTCEDLHDIASEPMTTDRAGLETNIDATPAVYVFTRLVGKSVVKVGQSDNARRRIVNGHLRYWNQWTASEVGGSYRARDLPWPQSLLDDQITLCIIPMPGKSADERLSLELWLKAKLHPELP
ncbi:hypothetical protein [Limnoglobus roseus]|uniref:GIY-YIG nuclease family protein n=1 Tax=Limnoglobus roseus TaxID=2598579 RepID=A0A5C1AH61_9BACT|nr:hypothetical protein [Limnoglobus roseus]QEL18759.1 hypothetical protein PX52LOC_05797 [Limnoglobus roseus]